MPPCVHVYVLDDLATQILKAIAIKDMEFFLSLLDYSEMDIFFAERTFVFRFKF